MRFRVAFLFLLAIVFSSPVFAQQVAKSSISGRITIKGTPVEGIVVSLEGPPSQTQSDARLGLITKTDANGSYRFDDVPKGEHTVAPRAYEYVMPVESNLLRPGRNLSVAVGENLEDVNFDLVKGAVITGRITESSGRPAMAQRVQIWKAGTGPRPVPYNPPGLMTLQTDDRGIYRIYGMPAGKYLVSVGVDTSRSNLVIGNAGRYSPIRYYPGVEDLTKATVIELGEGEELTDVDITMAKPEKTYVARIHVVDADTREPVVGAMVGYGNIAPGDGNRMGAAGFTGERTDGKGEILVSGLKKGRYGIFIRADEQSGYYADTNSFEVIDSDVDGVEVPARKGASIEGKIEIQSAASAPPNLREAIVRLSIISSPSPFLNTSRTSPDGSFQITGIPAGKARLSIMPPMGYRLVRYERDGAKFAPDLDVTAGEKVTGIRILIAIGTGTINGKLNFEGGAVPAGLRFFVSGHRLDEPSDSIAGPSGSIPVDTLGRFTIEDILPGDYEVQIMPISPPGTPTVKGLSPQKKIVSVGATVATVAFTIDLSQLGRIQ